MGYWLRICFGEWKETGWWYYYLYGLAVKLPLGTLLLFVLTVITALTACIRKRRRKTNTELSTENLPPPAHRLSALDWAVLLVPALSVLVLVSSQTGFNHHLRYVWPVLPFLFVLVGRSATPVYADGSRTKLRQGLAAACVLWSLGSSLCAYPHSLSYFNELAGGSRNGYKHLIHSSLDWGQDLLYVREWLDARIDSEPFYLAYYGAFNPEIVGVAYELPPQKPAETDNEVWLRQLPAGWCAISVNYLCGDRRAAPNGHGKKAPVGKNAYTAFQLLTPTRCLGGSIRLFRCPATPAGPE